MGGVDSKAVREIEDYGMAPYFIYVNWQSMMGGPRTARTHDNQLLRRLALFPPHVKHGKHGMLRLFCLITYRVRLVNSREACQRRQQMPSHVVPER